MKKQYIMPAIKTMDVVAEEQLMAGSIVETLKTEVISDSSEDFTQYSRHTTVWDEDEE